MALDLAAIQQPVAEELDHFEGYFRSALKTRVMLLDRIMRYVLSRKGKRLRPMLVLLSADLCGGIQPATYRGAALIELLHTATLVHDDVVDEADRRRGLFSINALWKNKAAVLVGDFLLSRGLLMSLEHDDFELLKIVSRAVKEMSEGELLQMEKSRTLNIDEPVYLEIIRQKTASLMASCTAVGAASVSPDPQTVETLRAFGEAVGMAFQIKDDLLDYDGADTGKPVGIDLRERKLTLPLIHTLNQASWAERRRMIDTIRRHNTEPKHVNWLVQLVRTSGGIDYAQAVMTRYAQQAQTLLDPWPESQAKTSLSGLVRFAVERER